MRLRGAFLVFAILAVLSISAVAQQTVNRYDLFTGYSHLTSPSVKLDQNGFNTSFGVNVKRWLALGADFSIFSGPGGIPISDTTIPAPVKSLLPAGLVVPFDASTYTFAAGPQINIRHFDKVMFFVRPGLGLIHERAQLKGVDTLIASLGPQLGITSSKLTDTTYFYGAGGGFDINASKHVGFRFSVDFVRTPLFSNLLEPRNAVRFSVGPTFKWGELK